MLECILQDSSDASFVKLVTRTSLFFVQTDVRMLTNAQSSIVEYRPHDAVVVHAGELLGLSEEARVALGFH